MRPSACPLPVLLALAACRSEGDATVVPGAPTLVQALLATAPPEDTAACATPTDADADGWDDAAAGGRDCDDADATVFPGADDPAGDGVDGDCDGVDGAATDPGCTPTGGETCDGVEEDCDGAIDDPWLVDATVEGATVALGALGEGGAPLLVVGVEGTGEIDGWLEVYAADGEPVVTIPGTDQSTTFGTQLATGRDVTGDGVVDLVVGAPYAEVGGVPNVGRVWVFPGPITAATTLGDARVLVEGGELGGQPGGQLALAPDLGGDGVDDVLVGWYRDVVVFSGVPDPTVVDGRDAWGIDRAQAVIEWNTGGGAWHFAAAPDHDADGLPELLLGMDTYGGGAGLVARYDSASLRGTLGVSQAAWSVEGVEGEHLGNKLLVVDGAVWTLAAAPVHIAEDGSRSPLPWPATTLVPAGDHDGDGRGDLLLATADAGSPATLLLVRADADTPTTLGTLATTLVPIPDHGLADPLDADADGLPDVAGLDAVGTAGHARLLGATWLTTPPCNADGDAYGAAEGDCDDADPDVTPLYGEERCDGRDDDCDGEIDEEGELPIPVDARDATSLGDLDGDGTAELALLDATGLVTAWDGEDATAPRFTVTGARVDIPASFGGAGDTDGNTFRELLVSTDAGVVLFPAGEDGDAADLATLTFRDATAWRAEGPAGTAGDLDGDGLDDVWLLLRSPAGAYALGLHTDPGVGTRTVDEATTLLTAPESWDLVNVAHALPAAPGDGDLDGDGLADLVVANPRSAYGDGRAFVILDRPSGVATMDAAAALLLYGDPLEGLGTTVALGGDFDGDGLADAALGGVDTVRVLSGGACPLFTARADVPATAIALADPEGDGRASLFLLDPDALILGAVHRMDAGLPATPWRAATGALGGLLARVGDTDGEGGDDLLYVDAGVTERVGGPCP